MKSIIQSSVIFTAIIAVFLLVDIFCVVKNPYGIPLPDLVNLIYFPTSFSFSCTFSVFSLGMFLASKNGGDKEFFLGAFMSIAAFFMFYGIGGSFLSGPKINPTSIVLSSIGWFIFFVLNLTVGHQIAREKCFPWLGLIKTTTLAFAFSFFLFLGIFLLLK